MNNFYNFLNKENLLDNPKIDLQVLEDNEKVFKYIANEMICEIIKNNENNKKTVFIVPVGPIGHYPYFIECVNKEKISLKNVWFINMDEYLTDDKEWISVDDKLSFRGFMNKNVYELIDVELVMPKEQRIFPDPKNIKAIPELIKSLGGVDICFGGIGINGHIAFNEADGSISNEEFLELETRVQVIAQETRTTNAIGDLNGALDDMPKYCVTIGMKEIFNSRKICLASFRDWHRSVVRHAAHGEKTSKFPVTLLQSHENISITFTEFVANLPSKE